MLKTYLQGLVIAINNPHDFSAMNGKLEGLRERFHPNLLSGVQVRSIDDTRRRAHHILSELIPLLKEGQREEVVSAGHGIGHTHRDYLHALALTTEEGHYLRVAFIGLIAGALHDIGTGFVERYNETNSTIRHAEAGAIIVYELLTRMALVNADEALLIAWGIAAHTHYLKSFDILCPDEVSRRVDPYMDTVDGRPFMPIWLPRWADRLDCSGAVFFARHLLTKTEARTDFIDGAFYRSEFAQGMRVIKPRTIVERGSDLATILEHFNGFARSQTNASPYGQHDHGVMTRLRDVLREHLLEIISVIVDAYEQETSIDTTDVMAQYQGFLQTKIEPSQAGINSAEKIMHLMHDQLDPRTIRAWCHGFEASMRLYEIYVNEHLLPVLTTIDPKLLVLPGTSLTARDVL